MVVRKRKDGGDDHDENPREPHREEADAVKVHEAYLQHRLGGGEPPSPEAYRRGVEQFEKLPGATRSTPAVEPEQPEKPAETKPAKGDDERETK